MRWEPLLPPLHATRCVARPAQLCSAPAAPRLHPATVYVCLKPCWTPWHPICRQPLHRSNAATSARPCRPAIALLAVAALLACAGSASAALTPAQMEQAIKTLQGQVKTLQSQVVTLNSNYNTNVKPLAGIKTKLLQVGLLPRG